MSLTIPSAWQAAVGLSGSPRLVFLLEVWTAQAVSRKFLSRAHDTLTYPVCVAHVTPYATELDVVERKIKNGAVDVVLERNAITDAFHEGNTLRGKKFRLTFGAPNLIEGDFQPYATGVIVDAIPSDGELLLIGDAITNELGRFHPFDAFLAKHPLEIMEDVLTAKVPANLIDSGTFDPADADYADISHFVTSRGIMFDGLDTREQKLPDTGKRILEELAFLLQGAVVTQEDGLVAFKRFDPSAAVVDTWQDEELGDVVVRSVYDNAINRINLETHKPWAASEVSGEYQAVTSDEDTDAQGRAAFHDDTSSQDDVREFSWATDWIQAGTAAFAAVGGPVVWTAVDPAPGDYVACLQTVHSFSGSRFPTYPSGGQPADAALSASRLLYARIGSEIVSFDQLVFFTDEPREIALQDMDSPDSFGPPPAKHVLRPNRVDLRVAARGALGTTAIGHTITVLGSHAKKLLDITMAVHCTEILVTRFRDGAPVVDVTTGLDKYAYQLGELVSLVTGRIRWQGHSGVTSATKWEIVRKEVLLHELPPRIEWTLVYASDSGAPAEAKAKVIRLRQGHGRVDAAGRALVDEVFADRHVVDDGGFDASDAGLVVTIEKGSASCQLGTIRSLTDRSFTLTASKETYVSFDLFSAAFVLYEQTTGSGVPADLGNQEVLLYRFVTDATTVTTTDDLRSYRAVQGARLYEEAISTAHRDPRDSPAGNLIRNGEFATTSAPNDETEVPPDGWELTGGAVWDSSANGLYFDTTTVESADRAIRFRSGNTLAGIGIETSKFYAIEPGALIFVETAFYLSAAAAGGDQMQVRIEYYNSAKGNTSNDIKLIPLNGLAATTWHEYKLYSLGDTSAAFFKIEIRVDNAMIPDVFCDRVRVLPGLSQFSATQDAVTLDQSVASGTTWVELTVCDDATLNIGADYISTFYRAPKDGTYAFVAIFIFVQLAAGAKAQVGIGTTSTPDLESAEIYNASGGAADVRVAVSGVLSAAELDDIKCWGRHDHGSNRDVGCIRFAGTQIEKR